MLSSTKVGRLVSEVIVNDVMNYVQEIEHKGIRMKFTVPNSLNRSRVESFSNKEPETLEWIDCFPDNAVIWDIGANVGLYSIYAAKKKNCRVFAFEPSIFNLELLARNLFLNNLEEQVTIMPFALSDELGESLMRMTSTQWGGALSTFGKKFGWNGESIKEVFAFKTFGVTMDQAVSFLHLPYPNFIKMDVDGIEHFILQSGPEVLSTIQGILVEINDDFAEQAENSRVALELAGLTLKDKLNSKMIKDTNFSNSLNQIWSRN